MSDPFAFSAMRIALHIPHLHYFAKYIRMCTGNFVRPNNVFFRVLRENSRSHSHSHSPKLATVGSDVLGIQGFEGSVVGFK